MNQQTLKKEYTFKGKGLHTGAYGHVRLRPAPVDTGIVFVRTDLDVEIPAVAGNVRSTRRSTQLASGKAVAGTVEHVISALTGLGVDNAYIEIDNVELPILDGSAKPYVDAILPDGLQEQDAPRRWLELDGPIEVKNEKTGAWIRITPADEPSLEVTIDFNSRVLGRQTVEWRYGSDYASQVAPCRTFCFLHEIWAMLLLGLIKGGDVENAIIIVEKPISRRRLAFMARFFKQPVMKVTPEGYLSNITLRFPDECGRHKLLDIIGDMRLCGGYLKARVEAFKPGHSLNTQAALEISKHSKIR